MLKVSPWKGVIHFGKRGKLNPRYIGHFKNIAKVGTVAYRLELPEQLSRVYSTFHVSNLKKCMTNEPLATPLDEIKIDDKLHFIKEPIEIMDHEVKRLKQSRILIVKVCWNSRRGPEFTWERADQIQKKYPHLFPNSAPVADATSKMGLIEDEGQYSPQGYGRGGHYPQHGAYPPHGYSYPSGGYPPAGCPPAGYPQYGGHQSHTGGYPPLAFPVSSGHGGHDGLGFLGGGVTVGAGVYGARPGSHGYGSHGYGSPGQESHGYGGYGQHYGNFGQHGDKLGYHKMWK
ncbi:hypothetical protein Tco_0843007 [Tanacetum coccineum]|uniref:Tf2-1-like SH3-like domain-containing protein n=1 Tax=Tanacetum coccineum TaxID=301880 RepID=A0ABQ5B1D2_9ASTR